MKNLIILGERHAKVGRFMEQGNMLKITRVNGDKGPLDEKIYIETNGNYLFTIPDLLNLVRIIGENEQIINREAIIKTGKFLL